MTSSTVTESQAKWQRLALVVLVLSGALLVLLAIGVVTRGPVATTDAQVDRWIGGHQNTTLTHLARVLSATAQAIVGVLVVLAIGALAAARERSWQPLVAAALTAAALVVSVDIAKHLVGSVFGALHPGVDADVGFPAGHPATATVMGGCALVLLGAELDKGRRRTAVIVVSAYAGAVGLSRLYLAVHRLSDVAGGWLIGSMLTLTLGLAWTHQTLTRPTGR